MYVVKMKKMKLAKRVRQGELTDNRLCVRRMRK